MKRTKIIFFGNGPLADYSLEILSRHFEIIFHAKTSADLEIVKTLKATHQDAFGVLASFGVIIKQDILDIFEPIGILNLHPSLLPKYRGASPIETAILNGDCTFSISIMKLVKAMDAGPIYYQSTITEFSSPFPKKSEIYQKLSHLGANWLVANLTNLPTPTPQDEKTATYTTKFDKSMSELNPQKTALELLNQIRAFDGFPKSKFTFFGIECTILDAHLPTKSELDSHLLAKSELNASNHIQPSIDSTSNIKSNTPTIKKSELLFIECSDSILIIDRLMPINRKPMDVKSFLNGYSPKSSLSSQKSHSSTV